MRSFLSFLLSYLIAFQPLFAAQKFGSDIDLQGNKLQNAKLDKLAVPDFLGFTTSSTPTAPSDEGALRLFANDGKLMSINKDGKVIEYGAGGGGGVGGINLLPNGSAAEDLEGWSFETWEVTRTTDAEDLPLAGVFNTAIKFDAVEAGNAKTEFFIPPSLATEKLTLSWAQLPEDDYQDYGISFSLFCDTVEEMDDDPQRINFDDDLLPGGYSYLRDEIGLASASFTPDPELPWCQLTFFSIGEKGAINLTNLVIDNRPSQTNFGNLKIEDNEISSTNTNGNIALAPNGTGTVALSKNTGITFPEDDLTSKGTLKANTTLSEDRSWLLPDLSGTVIVHNGFQQLTNKRVNSSNFAAGGRIIIPNSSYADADAEVRQKGSLHYINDTSKVYVDNGIELTPLGGSAPTGTSTDINLVIDPNGEDNLDNWAASDGGVETYSGGPLYPQVQTSVAINPPDAADYVEYCAQVSAGVKNKQAQLSWYQDYEAGYDAGDIEISVTSYTTGCGTGTPTTLLAATDIPAYKGGVQPIQIGLNNDDYVGIRFTRSAGTEDLIVQNLFLGITKGVKAPVITQWADFTPTWTNITPGTGSSTSGRWRRVGETMEIESVITLGTGGSVSGNIAMTIPDGKTYATIMNGGTAAAVDASVPSGRVTGSVYAGNGTDSIAFSSSASATWGSGIPFAWDAGDQIRVKASLVINEWAGSGVNLINVNRQSPVKAGVIMPYAGETAPQGWMFADGSELSQADYPDLFAAIGTKWNTATNPTTGSAYSAPSVGKFRIPDLRGMFMRGVGTPSGLSAVTLAGYQADKVQPHSHNLYANSGDTSSGSTTVVEMKLHTSATTNEYMVTAGNGADQSGAIGTETRPRNVGVNYIIKVWNDSIDTTGFGFASATEAGLYKAGQAPGTPTNDNASAGNVGEYVQASVSSNQSGSTTIATYTDVSGASITLTPGDWDISVQGSIAITSATGSGSTAALAHLVLADASNNILSSSIGGFSNETTPNTMTPFSFIHRVSINSSTTYKVRFAALSNTGSPTIGGIQVIANTGRPLLIRARRVR